MTGRPSLWCCPGMPRRVAALTTDLIYSYVAVRIKVSPRTRSAKSACSSRSCVRAARMMRSAVRWLTSHCAARPAADGCAPERRLGQDLGEPLVARVRVRLGGSAGGAGLVAAAHARAAVGRGPHRGPLPQRGGAALAGRAVGVGLGEVAQAAVGVDHVPAGVAQHAGGFGGVDQVVRVAVPVDLGQRLDLGPLVGLVPGGPLVLVPVVRPADPAGLLRVPRPGPVAVPAAGRGWSGRRARPCRRG